MSSPEIGTRRWNGIPCRPSTRNPTSQTASRMAPRIPGIPRVCRVSMCASVDVMGRVVSAIFPLARDDRKSRALPHRALDALRCVTMSATLDELPDRHVWTLHDHRVTQLVVELGAVRLVTWTLHASLDVRLGTAFTVRQADGIDRTADPDEPEQLAPLLTLVGRWAETLTATTEAQLVVT